MTQKWPARPAAEKAARVRENQRRHRAKTKAYIADLESEVASMRTRLREVLELNTSLVAEVEGLRARLQDDLQMGQRDARDATPLPSSGPASTTRTYAPSLRTSQYPRSPSSTRFPTTHVSPQSRTALPAIIPRPSPRAPSPPTALGTDISVRHVPTVAPTRIPQPTPPPTLPPPSLGSGTDQEPLPKPITSQDDENDSCECDNGVCSTLAACPATPLLDHVDTSGLRDTRSSFPASCPGESTIPCRTAFNIIKQQNFSGQDLATITDQLRPGFRRAMLEGDDCRVITNFVFSVIDVLNSV